MSLSIFQDAKAAIEELKRYRKQLPYATSRATNATAYDIRRGAFLAEFQSRLHLRNKFLMKGISRGKRGPGGVGITPSSKRDPVMTAEIFTGTGLEHLERHETGGVLRKLGRHRKTVPTKEAKRNSRGIIRKANRVRGILEREAKRGRGKKFFFIREGVVYRREKKRLVRERVVRGGKSRRTKRTAANQRASKHAGRTRTARRKVWSRKIRAVFRFVQSVRLRDRLSVIPKAHRIATKNFETHLDYWVARAMRTATR